MSIILAGLVLGYSLIVAIGPQNVFLIKQGIRREGITAVILACTISDIFLITAGTAGVGVLVDRAPIVLEILRWGGAVDRGGEAVRHVARFVRGRLAA